MLALGYFLSGGAFVHKMFPYLLQRECVREGTLLGTREAFATFVPEMIPGLGRRTCLLHQEISQEVEKKLVQCN